ncbi:hypothetical protein [Thiocapsa sp.]|uniref:hypothetical protein n=1 Tax=Thiocapsa sp. TaxID=2024551 RepID=UPI0025E088A3|nr:hypothetical protein [Thiocapsa sp.]
MFVTSIDDRKRRFSTFRYAKRITPVEGTRSIAAGFAAEFEGKSEHLNWGIEVEHVLNALKDEDIAEQAEEHSGILMGIFPEPRRFEGQLISGCVDLDLEDIGAFKTNWEYKKARLTFRVVSMRTNQRFILVDAARLEETIES